MRIGMLGPLEVRSDDGSPLEVGGARLRTLLIVLALEPGRVVSTARLVDGIWGEEPPSGAVNALQALVSRLRKGLPEATVESHPAGYRLVIDPDAVDVARFERLVAAGRSEPVDDTAATILRFALGLWRGPALLDVADVDFFRAPVARLSELRLAAIEERVDADLRLGRGAELVTELTSLVAEHPLRERLVGALMRALSVAGRPAEALTVYERARAALADELGADPSAELSELHTAVLRGELGTASRLVVAGEEPRTNLRAGLTSFVGRDEDVARVGKLVGEYRLTTLTGPGGSGKTRLAVETARALVEQTSDGVWLAELAPVTDGNDIPQAVLSAMGVREQAVSVLGPPADPTERLVGSLRATNALLVLDNCEHLIGVVATMVDRLLGECPRLRILATSREPLGITGEAVWPVEPLALPPPGAGLTEAMSYPAVRLLADRAAAARPGFAMTGETVPDVVRICRALDGMPLAIELAAARLRTMTPAQLAGRLDDRFRLLASGARVALPRHQTLRAVVDWSWELLSDAERVLLRRLALFSGGVTVESAERVCADEAADVLDLLASLTDKSLLVAGVDGRYRMLETIKAYGLERLDEAGERHRIRRAHAAYFAELAEAADPHLRRAEQLVWLDRLATEHDNITAAVRAAVEAGDAPSAVRLVAATGWFWWLGGHKAEGAELTAAALAVPGEVETKQLAVAYGISALLATAGLGDERQVLGTFTKARDLAERAGWGHPILRFLEPLGKYMLSADGRMAPPVDAMDTLLLDEDPWVRAQARINRGRTLQNLGRHTEAVADVEKSLAEFRTIGERWGMSFALTVLADLVADTGDLTGALEYYREAIVVVSEMGTVEDVLWIRSRQAKLHALLGDAAGAASAMAEADRDAQRVTWPDALAGLALAKAEAARWSGDLPAARTQLARAEDLMRHTVAHPVFRAMILDSLAYVDAVEGDLAGARAHRAEALSLALESVHAPTIAQVLVGIADQALRQDNPGEAGRLLAASEAVRGSPDRSHLDAIRLEKDIRAALGEDTFAEAARDVRDTTIADVPELAALTLAG